VNRLPNWLRAGLATSFFVAVPGFLLSLAGWLEDLAEWAAGDNLPFPDLSALRQASVALVLAVVLGAINAAVRYVQERANVGTTPVYPTTRRG
jgi:putative exporter of polyketide antibiotics